MRTPTGPEKFLGIVRQRHRLARRRMTAWNHELIPRPRRQRTHWIIGNWQGNHRRLDFFLFLLPFPPSPLAFPTRQASGRIVFVGHKSPFGFARFQETPKFHSYSMFY